MATGSPQANLDWIPILVVARTNGRIGAFIRAIKDLIAYLPLPYTCAPGSSCHKFTIYVQLKCREFFYALHNIELPGPATIITVATL